MINDMFAILIGLSAVLAILGLAYLLAFILGKIVGYFIKDE